MRFKTPWKRPPSILLHRNFSFEPSIIILMLNNLRPFYHHNVEEAE